MSQEDLDKESIEIDKMIRKWKDDQDEWPPDGRLENCIFYLLFVAIIICIITVIIT